MISALILRALLGGAGLAGCLALIAGEAKSEVGGAGFRRAPFYQPQAARPNVFGTVALPAPARRFAAGWERARRDASGSPRMAALIAPARSLSRDQQIAFVQAAVHRRIRWRSDATEWRRQDYWASAAETLGRGAGDMEDRAIVKLQALKCLGVPARDLYLTVGRDRVGGPETVLIVRSGGRYLVLDDTGGAPFPSDRRPDFEPAVTLGFGGSWLHGRVRGRLAATRAAGALALRR